MVEEWAFAVLASTVAEAPEQSEVRVELQGCLPHPQELGLAKQWLDCHHQLIHFESMGQNHDPQLG